ncbi:hypothetical protein GCM10009007_16330 [Formosimonas limnophila]|uniref:Uncharacterized protein n=1 Tax=Formosimonas limnophila TaxID=1384487 RepID=A0A8J3G078_9BURK|nr:hypothetical protein GCM10009007_16330 [Formosimonas limnophila]
MSMVTFKPRDSNNAAKDAAAMPLPKDETTPPVTNTYLVMKITCNGKRDYTRKENDKHKESFQIFITHLTRNDESKTQEA